MDISIPSAITRKYEVERGDVFMIEADTDDGGRLVLQCTRATTANDYDIQSLLDFPIRDIFGDDR